MRGVPFFSKRYTKREPFLSKMLYKNGTGRGWPRGGASPYKASLSTPPDFSHDFPFCLFINLYSRELSVVTMS